MIKGKWLKITEAAESIGCTEAYVRRLLIDGKLAGEKVGERAWLVDFDSVAKFAKQPKKTGRPRVSEKSKKTA